MKRIIFLLAIVGTLFMGCNPLEDIYEDIDAEVIPIVGSAQYTLTSENYTDDVEDGGLGLDNSSFNSVDEAKVMLPSFLSGLYPTWGEGSSVLVGYDLYIGNAFDIRDYNLDQEDYTFSGSDALGFQSDATPEDYLADILADAVSSPSEGDYRLAKYFQFTGDFGIVTPTVFLEENFDYDDSGDLTVVSDGVWTAHSGVGNGPVGYDAATDLTMTDYPTSGVGGSSTIDGSASEDVNSAFPEMTSGKVYASALVNLSAVDEGTYFFHVKDDGFTYSGRVGAKDDGSGKILFGIGASSSTLTYGTTAYDLNTTYLLVASYNIDSGVSNLYVLTTAEATEPTTPEATNSGSSGRPVSAVAYRQGSGGPTGTIDGVRAANTWSAIMSNEELDDEVVGDKEPGEMFYVYNGEAWEFPSDRFYAITDEDFASMGLESFGSDTSPDDYLPTFLGLKYPYALEGDNMDIGYTYDSSSSGLGTRGNLYTVIGGDWTAYESVISTSLQFGHDGNQWIPDNTIRYTFVGADYSYIVATYADIYPDLTTNMADFGNFNGFSWTDEQILEVVGAVLLNNNPGAEEGQQYIVTYSIYDGSTHDEDISVILEGGVYVLNN